MNAALTCSANQEPGSAWRATHIPFLQKRQDLGDVVEPEDPVGGFLESVKLKVNWKETNISDRYDNPQETKWEESQFC